MKQQLWILNSSLLCMLMLAIGVSYFLVVQIPPFKKRSYSEAESLEPRVHLPIKLDLFVQNDIFGTMKNQTHAAPVKQSLVSEIPKLTIPQLPLPPEPKAPEFIPPLTVTLNGIIVGSDELLSIAMLVDETGKEGIYHVGDKLKDGTIVRITRNRVVVFRANGQQEIFYLRKENITPPGATVENRWTYVAKKIEDKENYYQLDPHEFGMQIESLGELIEMLGAIPVYSAGKTTGIKINKANPAEVAPILGLEKDDIITAINDLSTNNTADRLKIYENVTQLKTGDQLKVSITRKKEPKILTYILGRIPRVSKYAFAGNKDKTGAPAGLPDMFKKTILQEHNAQQKDFEVRHQQRYDDTIADIRKRLLNNMNLHAPNSRIR